MQLCQIDTIFFMVVVGWKLIWVPSGFVYFCLTGFQGMKKGQRDPMSLHPLLLSSTTSLSPEATPPLQDWARRLLGPELFAIEGQYSSWRQVRIMATFFFLSGRVDHIFEIYWRFQVGKKQINIQQIIAIYSDLVKCCQMWVFLHKRLQGKNFPYCRRYVFFCVFTEGQFAQRILNWGCSKLNSNWHECVNQNPEQVVTRGKC